MYDYNYGFINQVLVVIGIAGPTWTANPKLAMPSLILVDIWHWTSFMFLIILAGLESQPLELNEAARVDGASEFNIFRYIILPLLRPVTLSAMVILGHMSLKTFDLVIATVGKQLVLDMPSVHMWQITFDGLQYGSGAAISILLLIFTAVLIVPYLFFSLRKEVKQ
jgi:glucose/mannose transport system permease protein